MTRASYEIHRDRNDAIIAMWNANQTAAVIADKFDIDAYAVHQVVYRRRARGQAVRWGIVGHNRDRYGRIIELVESGKRNAQIARMMDLSPNAVAGVVWRHYKALGIKRPKPMKEE